MKTIADIANVDLQGLLTEENLAYLHELEQVISDKHKKSIHEANNTNARHTEDMVEDTQIDMASNLAVDDDLMCDEEVVVSHPGVSAGK